MAHVGGDWEIGAVVVKDCKNVLVDTSGSIFDAGMVEYAVKLLGAERVVYGSDNCDMAGQLAKVLAAEITSEEKRMILAENIERVMKP
jgi:predicted TIM-barrel fold metal-dependent hydrolase